MSLIARRWFSSGDKSDAQHTEDTQGLWAHKTQDLSQVDAVLIWRPVARRGRGRARGVRRARRRSRPHHSLPHGCRQPRGQQEQSVHATHCCAPCRGRKLLMHAFHPTRTPTHSPDRVYALAVPKCTTFASRSRPAQGSILTMHAVIRPLAQDLHRSSPLPSTQREPSSCLTSGRLFVREKSSAVFG
jgi:hypothetical protein